MQELQKIQTIIIDKLIDSRIINILEIINQKYPETFPKSIVEKELVFIKNHIICKKNKKQKQKKKCKRKVKEEKVDVEKVEKVEIDSNNSNTYCSGRIWHSGIFNIKNMKIVDNLEKQYLVDDFKLININTFNSKYQIGLRCKNKHIFNSKYCKLHNKHLIHGDFLEPPSKELCFHFIKDGNYI
jgi:hypothetical protein